MRIGLLILAIAIASCTSVEKERSETESEWSEGEYKASKAARLEYLFHMLRDPATNAIPPAVRKSELRLAARINAQALGAAKTGRTTFNWFEIGPHDVGGRTRALAIDRENPNRLLAGGVSGGLWESTDSGTSWRPLALDAENLSVTYIAQDPGPGRHGVWYYASGEFYGNSASDLARRAAYFGSGLYKSIDNGKTWSLLPAGTGGGETVFDSPFDFVSRIAISPTTGTVLVASNAYGIFRSDDRGNSFGPAVLGQFFPDPVLGRANDHLWSDVAVNDEGIILAVLSSTGFNDSKRFDPGVYISFDDGITWTNISPSTFPQEHGRSVIAFAPSNPDVAYIYTTTNREIVYLHKLNLADSSWQDLTDNLPLVSLAGDINTQAGYNMALAVKPDDENFVLLGGTNVYRSRDGFSSEPTEPLDFWIGGYDAIDDDFGYYENHHPDQHIFLFDPTNPNRLWTGNDGGVYMTNDISHTNEVVWNDMNAGYNVTQFYTVAIPDAARDPRIAGGTQDNGTPFMRLDDPTNASKNISVGDGANLYLGDAYAYVGFQNGATLRLQYNADDTPNLAGYSFIQPIDAFGQLFITPFVVDPIDENIMYYAAGASLWRNDQLGSLPRGQSDSRGTDEGWTELTDIPFTGVRIISAIAVSRSPAHRLYFGASDTRAVNPQPPTLYRIKDATEDLGERTVDISIPDAPPGAYISDIAINPNDANELLVVMSNYGITGLYHSKTGGSGFKPVEGNLEGDRNEAGPSLRSAAILPLGDETHYFVGTSIGLYRTTVLDGRKTTWLPEASDAVGQSVVTDVMARDADGVVAVATHGRGLFLGSPDEDFDPSLLPESFDLAQNYPNPFASVTRISYDLPERSRVGLALFDLSGRRVSDLVVLKEQSAGRHYVTFDAANVVSGVYLYRLRVVPLEAQGNAAYTRTRKMMIVK